MLLSGPLGQHTTRICGNPLVRRHQLQGVRPLKGLPYPHRANTPKGFCPCLFIRLGRSVPYHTADHHVDVLRRRAGVLAPPPTALSVGLSRPLVRATPLVHPFAVYTSCSRRVSPKAVVLVTPAQHIEA